MNRVDYACAIERTRKPQRLRALRRLIRELWRFITAPRCHL